MHDNLNLLEASAAACLVMIMRTCGQTDVTSWLVWLTWGACACCCWGAHAEIESGKGARRAEEFLSLHFAYEDVWDRGVCVWGGLSGHL